MVFVRVAPAQVAVFLEPSIPYGSGYPSYGTCVTSGTRRPSRWYASRPAVCFFRKRIYAQLLVIGILLINFCIFVYFLYWFFKMTNITSHSHLFVPFLCQAWLAKRLIEWYLVEWVFMKQGGTQCSQHSAHKCYTIREFANHCFTFV